MFLLYLANGFYITSITLSNTRNQLYILGILPRIYMALHVITVVYTVRLRIYNTNEMTY